MGLGDSKRRERVREISFLVVGLGIMVRTLEVTVKVEWSLVGIEEKFRMLEAKRRRVRCLFG